ncbi:MAG: hypothetical protein Q8R18_00450 [bacterium]|nr:hypothetical protein [bacterium]
MRKFILLFFAVLFLVACTQQTPEGEELAGTCPPDCSGGSSSIVTTVNSPQDEGNVYVGDRLAVSANLEDRGESNAEGLVCITGLDGSIFSGLGGCNCESFYISIDDTDDANFEKTRVDFSPSFVSEDASGSHHMTMYTRYLYTAYGPFTLCLTGDPYNEKECSVEGNKVTGSSSGPLKIISISEELTNIGGNAVNLRLRIEAEANLDDTAQLVELDETSDSICLLTNTDQKTSADVSVILFGESNDCGKITFDQGEDTATITCKIENVDTDRFIGGQKEYDGWIRIDYGYQEIQSVAFDVVSE